MASNPTTTGLSTVFKFDIKISDVATEIALLPSATILHVAKLSSVLERTVQVWALVPIDSAGVRLPGGKRKFVAVQVGARLTGQMKYCATVLEGTTAWHIFEDISGGAA